MGLIYKACNVHNGKCYIGKTVKQLSRRKTEHKNYAIRQNGKSAFPSAIRKYGFDSFSWEILEDSISNEYLNEREAFYIKENKSNTEGYNMTNGGDGAPYGDANPSKRADVKLKLKIANTGYKHTSESLRIMSMKSKAYFDKHSGMPEEHKLKISKGSRRLPGKNGSDHIKSRKGFLISPDGEKHSFDGVREFAKNHDLDHSCVSKLLNGKLKTHKGWSLGS